MKKSQIKIAPDYFKTYIDKVEDIELLEALDSGGIELYLEELDTLSAIGSKTYENGKWTVKQIIEHLIDTERLFISRALRFVREDKTDLPSYDENAYADSARSNERTLNSLLEEYQLVRLASIAFFSNLNEEELSRTGIAGGKEISVLAIGFILVGHPIHHFEVIMERYSGLVSE